jgi:methylenetetrahydrofolate reductase (NADPH)
METPEYSEAAYHALAANRYEVIPIKGVIEQAGLLPAGATVTVTCSPKLGLDRTLQTAEVLLGMGYVAVPHIAARLVEDRRHLRAVLDRIAASGLNEVFVVGGDATRPAGPFTSGSELLAEMAELSRRPGVIGIPAYPDGHGLIDDETLNEALRAKAAHADYMVTQLCFDPSRILEWLERMHGEGITLPAYVGIAGAVAMRRLVSIAWKIGLGDSTRLLRKNAGTFGKLLHSSGYTPDDVVWPVLADLDTVSTRIAGFHINTFNNVDATLEWKTAAQEALRARCVTSAGDPPAMLAESSVAPSGTTAADPLLSPPPAP